MEIWKFDLRPGTGLHHVAMPAGSRLLSVKWQGGGPKVWALCDSGAPPVERRLLACGTGDSCDGAHPFLGTVMALGSVLHVFDLGELPAPSPAERGQQQPRH